jgi:hypothetical protein
MLDRLESFVEKSVYHAVLLDNGSAFVSSLNQRINQPTIKDSRTLYPRVWKVNTFQALAVCAALARSLDG